MALAPSLSFTLSVVSIHCAASCLYRRVMYIYTPFFTIVSRHTTQERDVAREKKRAGVKERDRASKKERARERERERERRRERK